MKDFHNTIKHKGAPLKKATKKAKSQSVIILNFFKLNQGLLFTPCEVHEALFDINTPLTSIRARISTLEGNNKLEQTAVKREGIFGMLNGCWTYKN